MKRNHIDERDRIDGACEQLDAVLLAIPEMVRGGFSDDKIAELCVFASDLAGRVRTEVQRIFASDDDDPFAWVKDFEMTEEELDEAIARQEKEKAAGANSGANEVHRNGDDVGTPYGQS